MPRSVIMSVERLLMIILQRINEVYILFNQSLHLTIILDMALASGGTIFNNSLNYTFLQFCDLLYSFFSTSSSTSFFCDSFIVCFEVRLVLYGFYQPL